LTCLLLSRKKNKNKKMHLSTIKKNPDMVWNEKKVILPKEKPLKTVVVGRPSVPYKTVLEGILHVLRTRCQWNSLLEEYGSGSACHHRRFQQWVRMDVSISERNYGSGY
jgi:hypothetical protein